MVKMTAPMTGTIVYVAESRVEKYKKAGYKLAKKGKAKAEPEPEPEEGEKSE